MYQGRFQSFPVQEDEHFCTLCRYVERNGLRAKLVRRAEQWRWGSLWRMTSGDREARSWLSLWPLPRPRRWVDLVNEPQTEAELAALRGSVQRGCPYGEDDWVEQTARELGLETTLRPRGRPRN